MVIIFCPTAVGLFIPRKTNRTGVRGLYGSDTDIHILKKGWCIYKFIYSTVLKNVCEDTP